MKKNLIIVLTVALLSLVLSLFILRTPTPVMSVVEEKFSAVNAASYIEVISREPHSVFALEAREEVRLYLKSKLEEFVGAANVSEYNYSAAETGEDIDYDVKNLWATIPGTSPTGILLVAHYDCRGPVGSSGTLGRSYGAADDGYGLSVLLEIARLYGNTNPQNSIYLLMTDAEENGLIGAKMAVTETELMDKVGFVINIEARGVKGQVYMFETSSNNAKVMDFYKFSKNPFSYSIATAVYSIMPNATDFQEFLGIGKAGINFSTLDSVATYHTPEDSYVNIDLSTIQSYGAQIVPLVEEFSSNSQYSDVDYFQAESSQVFFMILPGVMIQYSETAGLIMSFVILALLLGIAVYLILKKRLCPLSVLKYLGFIIAAILIYAILGLLLSLLLAFVGETIWSPTYMLMDHTGLPTALFLLFGAASMFFLYHKLVKKEESRMAFIVSGILVNAALAIVTGLVLSGASFLFLIPALFGVLAIYANVFIKNKIIRQVVISHNLVWNILIIVPLLYSLFLALTAGGLLAFMIILAIDFSVAMPLTFEQINLPL